MKNWAALWIILGRKSRVFIKFSEGLPKSQQDLLVIKDSVSARYCLTFIALISTCQNSPGREERKPRTVIQLVIGQAKIEPRPSGFLATILYYFPGAAKGAKLNEPFIYWFIHLFI